MERQVRQLEPSYWRAASTAKPSLPLILAQELTIRGQAVWITDAKGVYGDPVPGRAEIHTTWHGKRLLDGLTHRPGYLLLEYALSGISTPPKAWIDQCTAWDEEDTKRVLAHYHLKNASWLQGKGEERVQVSLARRARARAGKLVPNPSLLGEQDIVELVSQLVGEEFARLNTR